MAKWLLVATLMGITGGLSALLLNEAIAFVERLSQGIPLWLAPAIGGTLVAVIYGYDKLARGFGTNRYIFSINRRNGDMRNRTFLTKLAATALTLGLRGSGGVEGPMLVIGGSIGNLLTKVTPLRHLFRRDDLRLLSICGAAGAIGAIFRSPLGGGIFVVEVLYRSSLHYSDLFPAILSSTMGFVAYSFLAHAEPLFVIPAYVPDVGNVPWFLAAASLAGVVSFAFMELFSVIRSAFKRIPFRGLRPILGGVLTGLILVYVPQAAGIGTDFIQGLITEVQPLRLIVLLLVGKTLATSFTVGSGGSAGLVIPALFVGALVGNFTACLAGADGSPLTASLAVSGMAASLAAVANVPIAAAVMLVEMVGMQLGVPAVLGSVVGYAIGRSRTIYGTTRQYEEEFEEGKDFRKLERQLEDH